MKHFSETRGKVIDTKNMKAMHCFFATKKMVEQGDIKSAKKMIAIAIKKAESRGWDGMVKMFEEYAKENIPS